ncbi:hypothetical protein [Pararhizobium sp.]|uniref:hypothetical protein n=1 Tax=Pararhizobium sp. TaxID=1977563 RepID=UPI003D0B6022
MSKINGLTLKSLLVADALTCTAMGTMLLAGSAAISPITHIPQPLLHYAGLSLFPIAAFMALTVMASTPRWAVNLVILGNLLWAVASVLLPAGGFIAPNALGWFALIGQAAIVALLAKLERGASGNRLAASRA